MSRPVYSELMKALTQGKFVFTGELEPVKTTSMQEFVEGAKILKGHVVACNVTDIPAAFAYMNSLVPSYLIQREAGLEAIYQMTVRDRNRLALFADILAAACLGIKNILALSGDHSVFGDNPQAKPVYDLDSAQLVYMIRRMVDEGVDLQGNKIHEPPKLHVGMAANPGAIPLEPEILKLERKVNIGAEFIQTQVVYDIEVAKKFLDATSHLKIPIIIGICPLKSYAMAKFMNQFVPGVVIPDEIMARVKKAEKMSKEQLWKENIEIFGELIREIRKTRAAGVHIMAVGFEKIVPSLIEAGTK